MEIMSLFLSLIYNQPPFLCCLQVNKSLDNCPVWMASSKNGSDKICHFLRPPYMRGSNSSNSVNVKYKRESVPNSIQQTGLPGLFCPQSIASKGIFLLQIGMIPDQMGYPAVSFRGKLFLFHTRVKLLSLWALFLGYLAAGVVMGKIFLLLILHPMGSGH